MGINTGLRRSDLLPFTLGQVLDQKMRPVEFLSVTELKTGKTRKILLNNNVQKAINELVASKEDINPMEYLFKSQKGGNQPITRIQAWKILNDAARTVGIDSKIGTHTLRKTFGYHAYKQGIDITLLMDLFNHSTRRSRCDTLVLPKMISTRFTLM